MKHHRLPMREIVCRKEGSVFFNYRCNMRRVLHTMSIERKKPDEQCEICVRTQPTPIEA